MSTRSAWSRQELLIALNLYCQIPFGRMHAGNPLVIEISEQMGRTPSALAMKLTNFASLDPEIVRTGRRGLGNVAAADMRIWEEMQADWETFALEADNAVTALGLSQEVIMPVGDGARELTDYTGGERSVEAISRVGQQFFRRAVLSAYNYRCCVTGLAVPGLLLASHIIPWRMDVSNRLNPRNGLCLSALHDRAFDAGYITIREDMTVSVSTHIPSADDTFFESAIRAYDGMSIALPEKFSPIAEFLSYHREHVFQGTRPG
jgi:hypothetical protein